MKKIYLVLYLSLFIYFSCSFIFYKKDFYAFLVALTNFLFFIDSIIKNKPTIIKYLPTPVLFIVTAFYIILNWIGVIIALLLFSVFMLEYYYITKIMEECNSIYTLYRLRLDIELQDRQLKKLKNNNSESND